MYLRQNINISICLLSFIIFHFPFCFLISFIPSLTSISIAFSLDKKATTKRWSLVNFDKLNNILRFEIFLHRDGQLWAAHVILGFKPISTRFQVLKHVIKAKDSRLARVDMPIEGFIRKPSPTGTQLIELPTPQVTQPLVEGEKIISLDNEAEAQSEEVEEEAKEESSEILV